MEPDPGDDPVPPADERDSNLERLADMLGREPDAADLDMAKGLNLL